ncbi:MAG: ankyrin repeat domain-containing protein [Rickettsiales bacterium]|nr:ankyrin repeat domain-containing protein [Rickettsiales bacterium]
MSKNVALVNSENSLSKILSPEERLEKRSLLAEESKKIELDEKFIAAVQALKNTSDKLVTEELIELINQGADIEAKGEGDFTALIIAIDINSPDAVRFLVGLGADIDYESEVAGTALKYAITENNVELIKLLLELGADIKKKDYKGQTLLFHTSNKNTAKLLIEMGVNVNDRDNNGETALIYAVIENSPAKVKMLMELGADIRVRDNEDRTALMVASILLMNKNLELSDLVRDDKYEVKHYLITNRIADIIKVLKNIIISSASNWHHNLESDQGLSDWDFIKNVELTNPEIQNSLDKEIVIFLASILPELDQNTENYNRNNDVRRQILEKFKSPNPNQSNPANQTNRLNEEDLIKITQLKKLKEFLLEVLTPEQNLEPQQKTKALAKITSEVNGIIAIFNSSKNIDAPISLTDSLKSISFIPSYHARITNNANSKNLPNLNLDRQTAIFLATVLPEFIEAPTPTERSDKKIPVQPDKENQNFLLNLSLARTAILEQFNAKNSDNPLNPEFFYPIEEALRKSLIKYIKPSEGETVKNLSEILLIPASKQLFKIIAENIQEKNSSQDLTAKQSTENGKMATNLEIETPRPNPNLKNNISAPVTSQHQTKNHR